MEKAKDYLSQQPPPPRPAPQGGLDKLLPLRYAAGVVVDGILSLSLLSFRYVSPSFFWFLLAIFVFSATFFLFFYFSLGQDLILSVLRRIR